MNKPLLFFCFGVLSLSPIIAETASTDTLRMIDLHIDTILNLAQAYPPGQVRNDLVAEALQIRRLLSSSSRPIESPRLLGDQEFNQLLVSLRGTKNYKDQRGLLLQAVSQSRVSTLQVKRLVSFVADAKDKRDALGLLYPAAVDPENVDQLLETDSSNEAPKEAPQVYQDAEVERIVARIKAAWPYNGQKVLIQNLPASPKLTVSQVKKIVGAIDFDRDKKEVLTMILPGAVDPEHVDLLFDTFWTPSDKEFLNALVRKK